MPSANHLVFECDVLASEITDGEVRVNLGFQGGIGGGDEDKGIGPRTSSTVTRSA